MENQSDLVTKMDKLQKEMFRVKCIALVLFFCLVAVSLANSMRHPKIIEANQFLVRDETGNILARLGQSEFGDACLLLTAKQNVSAASLCVQDAGGSLLDMHNTKDESRVTLTPGFTMHEPMLQAQPGLVIIGNGKELRPPDLSPPQNPIEMPVPNRITLSRPIVALRRLPYVSLEFARARRNE